MSRSGQADECDTRLQPRSHGHVRVVGRRVERPDGRLLQPRTPELLRLSAIASQLYQTGEAAHELNESPRRIQHEELNCMQLPLISTYADFQEVLSIGAAGGSTIISGVAGAAFHVLHLHHDVKEAIDFPRLHNQLKPNVTEYETRWPLVRSSVALDHLLNI